MGWFSSSPVASVPLSEIAPLSNLTSESKPHTEKVKPCCVCKDEKAQRDECMLYSQANDPQEDCKNMVMKYKDCMTGYGFKI